MSQSRIQGVAKWAQVALLAWPGVAAMAADTFQPDTAKEPLVASRTQEAPLSMPASQHELWQRLLKLLAEDGGFTPKDRVEAVLGVRFTETRQETDPPTIGAAYKHLLEVESEGLGQLRIALFDDPRHTDLVIRWGRSHCLSILTATQDLFRLGWGGGKRGFAPPWRIAQVDFHLPEEAAYVAEYALRPGTSELPQRLTKLYLRSSYGHQSDCLDSFSSDVWRTPLHKQPTNTDLGE